MTEAAEQVDRKLKKLRPISSSVRPPQGWLRAIRQALGMTTAQLAHRLEVSQPRVIEMEKAEASSAITLKSLERAAEALGCRVVYILVPDEPLANRIRKRALEMAEQQLRNVEQTMSLEDQAVFDKKHREREKQKIADDLLKKLSRLWDQE